MTTEIKATMSVDGVKDVTDAIRKIGTEGEAAGRKLQAAFKDVTLGRSFVASLNNFKSAFAGLKAAGQNVSASIERVGNSLRDVRGAFASTATKVGIYGAALTGAAAAGALFVKGSLDKMGELNDLASAIGTTSEQLQGFQLAGVQAGFEADTLVKVVASLGDTLKELDGNGAATGLSQLSGSFKITEENGVRVIRTLKDVGGAAGTAGEDATKLSDKALALQKVLDKVGIPRSMKLAPIEAFKAIADAFSQMQDGAEKTQLSVDLLGPKLGPRLIPMLNMGAKGIDQYKDQLKDLGILISNEAVSASDNASDALGTLNFFFEQYRAKFAAEFAPEILKAFSTIYRALDRNSKQIGQFVTGMADKFVSVMEDILTLATGGPDSGVKNQWVLDLRDGLIATATAAKDLFENVLYPAFTKIREAAMPVADAINAIFGTKLTGDQLLIGAVIVQMVGGFKLLFATIGLGTNTIRLFFDILGSIGPLGKLIGSIWPLLKNGVTMLISVLPDLLAFMGPQGLIALGVIALGALLYEFWDQIVAGAQAAFEFLGTFLTSVWEGIRTVAAAALMGVAQVFSDTWVAIKTATSTAFEGFQTMFSDTWTGITNIASAARDGLVTVASDTWAGITSTVAMARDSLFAAASQTWGAITEAATGIANFLAPIWQGIANTASAAFSGIANLVSEAWAGASQAVVNSANAIRDAIATATNIAGNVQGAAQIAAALVQPFIDAKGKIAEVLDSFGGLADSAFNAISNSVAAAGNDILRMISAVISALQRAAAEAAQLRAQASGGGSGYATGGYVSGPGGPTSDSIPAWLSNGEFVVRAAAVRKYGVDFLRGINGLRAGPLFNGGLPGFALGGLVSLPSSVSAAPATGASGRPVVLTLGEQSFQMVADNDVAEKLIRYSAKRRMNSAGRKPSWFGA